jgi:hypothetical protein
MQVLQSALQHCDASTTFAIAIIPALLRRPNDAASSADDGRSVDPGGCDTTLVLLVLSSRLDLDGVVRKSVLVSRTSSSEENDPVDPLRRRPDPVREPDQGPECVDAVTDDDGMMGNSGDDGAVDEEGPGVKTAGDPAAEGALEAGEGAEMDGRLVLPMAPLGVPATALSFFALLLSLRTSFSRDSFSCVRPCRACVRVCVQVSRRGRHAQCAQSPQERKNHPNSIKAQANT